MEKDKNKLSNYFSYLMKTITKPDHSLCISRFRKPQNITTRTKGTIT
jgi:hypothetical protein